MPQNQKFEIPQEFASSGRGKCRKSASTLSSVHGWGWASRGHLVIGFIGCNCPTPVQARLSLGVSRSLRLLPASVWRHYAPPPTPTTALTTALLRALVGCFGVIPRLLGNRHVRDNDQKSGSSIFAQRRNGSEVPRFRQARFHAALGPAARKRSQAHDQPGLRDGRLCHLR